VLYSLAVQLRKDASNAFNRGIGFEPRRELRAIVLKYRGCRKYFAERALRLLYGSGLFKGARLLTLD
jgi:hypothetical protein